MKSEHDTNSILATRHALQAENARLVKKALAQQGRGDYRYERFWHTSRFDLFCWLLAIALACAAFKYLTYLVKG